MPYYSLKTAPEWVARPRRDALGRALRMRMGGLVCEDDHGDDQLVFYVKPTRAMTQSGTWECRTCRRLRERERVHRTRSSGTWIQPEPPPVATVPPGGWTPRHPFDFTRVRLEAEWGPYATWTLEQHREHTRRIYHLIGWGDAAISQPVPGFRHRAKETGERRRRIA